MELRWSEPRHLGGADLVAYRVSVGQQSYEACYTCASELWLGGKGGEREPGAGPQA